MATGHLANILMYSGQLHGASLSYRTLNGSKQLGDWLLGSILCLVTGHFASRIVILLVLLQRCKILFV